MGIRRDKNLQLEREHKTDSEYLHEEHGTSSSLKILHPAAFRFKEKQVLAAHPPSCHPRRVFGGPEKIEKKMREKGAADEKRGRAESFSPKIYCKSD